MDRRLVDGRWFAAGHGFGVALLLVEQRVPPLDVAVARLHRRERRLVEVRAGDAAGFIERDGHQRLGGLARDFVTGEGEDALPTWPDRPELAVRVALAELRVDHVHAPLAAGAEVGIEAHHLEGLRPPPAPHEVAIFPQPPDEA